MKKTISQRFFLSLCLMIVGCLWGSAAWAETVTYTVTSKSTVTTSGSKPSGSSATYSSTYATTAQLTKNNSMTLTLSGYAGKKITGITLSMKSNSDSGAGYLSVKAGTTTLASIGSPSSGVKFNNRAWYGKWSSTYVNVTPTMSNDAYAIQNNEDVVILIGATASSLYCQSFTLTYEDAGPTLLVPSEPISFGDIETGYNDTKTFSISGMKLTADATLEITGTNAAMFRVSPTTITATDGNIAATDVTVTYTPTATGDHSATLTISSGDLSREVSLSGTGIAPLTHYTVSWMVNGETYTEGTPSTDVAEGKKVETLPTNPAAIGSNVFMGWTASTITGTSAVAPGDLFTTAKDAPAVTSNTIYYAVFAKLSSSTSSWNRVKTLAEITNGSYVIKSGTYVLPSTKATSSQPKVTAAPTISGDVITGTVEESITWYFTSTGKANQFYVKNSGGDYLYASNDSKGIRVSSTSDKWTFYDNTTGYFSMLEATNSRYCGIYNNQDWRSYKSATSDYSNGGKLELYKLVNEETYNNYATTIVAKEQAGLAFEQATYYAEVNEIITVTATNASGAKITYSVDNGTHAIVDENTGVFYADAVGTYTITATCPAIGNYYAGMTTCQVIVTQPAANIHATTYYKKITSSDELVDGGVYLIVCESKNEAMGVIDEANERCLGAAITLNGNTYTGSVNQSDHPYEVTITEGNNGYYNLYHAGGKYITSTSTDFAFAATGDNGWSISFDGGNAIISNKNTAENYIQRYNSNNYYKNYQSVQTPIQLYQKVGEMPIAKATGYVSTYVADFAYVMPKHITGHTVALADKQGVISTTKVFRAGDEVPALTPLLIKSDEDYAAKETSRNYNPAVLNKTVDAYEGDNMLEYRRTAQGLTNTMKDVSVYYYKLAIKNQKVGFYWGEANGDAFTMTKPSTAYLTVPQTMNVQGFVLNLEEGETTGIATVVTNEDAPIYNLQGIRMNGKNLPKGIYIQGGKKFMVK